MLGILQGFTLILGVIGAGYATGRAGVVKGEQRRVLNSVAFYVATPALLFSVLHDSDPGIILSPVMVVSTVAALVAAGLFVVASKLWLKLDLASIALGSAASGYVNANNLGLPVAIYILGDIAYVPPLMLLQMVVFAPVILSILEGTRPAGGITAEAGAGTGTGTSAAAKASTGATFLRALGRTAANPVIIASVAGLLVAIAGWAIPSVIMAPIDMLGDAAIPMVLLSFGISLHGQRPLQAGTDRRAVLIASAIKLVAMPLVAWAVAVLLGLGPHEVFVATVMGALPAAQNVYNFAATYRRAEVMVRDSIMITTFLSLPVIALVALLLG